MAAIFTLQVERSLVPGLSRIPVTRCPPMPSRSASTMPVFEMPELASRVARGGEGGASEPPVEPGSQEAARMADGALCVGSNVVVGGLYGLCSRVLQPGLQRLARRAGPLAPAVKIGGEAGAFGLAYAMAGLLRESTKRLGGVVMKVPILGANTVVGRALQFGVASFIGDRLGSLLALDVEEACENGDGPIFLANMCVMCNTPFIVGEGQRVASLNCGHACLCTGDPGAAISCVSAYMAGRQDCPLCRAQPIHVMHELRV